MLYDGILFDLDGTLWDSSRSVAESWNLTLARLSGRPGSFTAEDVCSIMGMTEAQIAARLFSGFGDGAAVCRLCLRDEGPYLRVHGGRLYPGIPELLRELSARVPLFIVSNCQTGYIESFLDFSGLRGCFADTRCEGDNGRGKAENIRLLCREHGLARPVYVGDTAMDERATAEAGCPFIHVTYGFGAAKAPAAAADCAGALLALLKGENHV